MKRTKLWLSMLLVGSTMAFLSCSSDDDNGGGAANMTVSSITAKGSDLSSGEPKEVDLNATTSGADVPLDAKIEIAFSKSIDASTATTGNINITAGSDMVDADINTSGSTVTLTPKEDLKRGTNYTLNISNGVTAEDGGKIAALTRTFKTAGRSEVDPPQAENLVAYWNLDGTADASVGGFETVFDQVSYDEDRFGFMGGAAKFGGATEPGNGDIIEIKADPAFMTPSRTISFWFKADGADYEDINRFVIGQAFEKGFFVETGGSLNWLKFATSHKLKDIDGYATNWFDAINGGGADIEEGGVLRYNFEGDVSEFLNNKWANVIMTYDATTGVKIAYINGVKMREEATQNSDEWPMIDMAINESGVEDIINTNLTFGYAASRDNAATDWANYQTATNTFKGLLDDIRIFSVALSETEAKALYDAEKP